MARHVLCMELYYNHLDLFSTISICHSVKRYEIQLCCERYSLSVTKHREFTQGNYQANGTIIQKVHKSSSIKGKSRSSHLCRVYGSGQSQNQLLSSDMHQMIHSQRASFSCRSTSERPQSAVMKCPFFIKVF